MSKLNELLELKYRTRNTTKATIDKVYGIIYRIYCIPEDKSYIKKEDSIIYAKEFIEKYKQSAKCNPEYILSFEKVSNREGEKPETP